MLEESSRLSMGNLKWSWRRPLGLQFLHSASSCTLQDGLSEKQSQS